MGQKRKKMNKEVVVAPLNMEIASLKEVAKALDIPEEKQRQPDLQYLTAIFVSSGMNRNGAVFMGSELVKARNSVNAKAVDIEHDEQTIVGHITDTAFLNREGAVIDAEVAATEMSVSDMDKLDIDIAIAAVIHKERFPELAEEIAEGDWMVSMECFYEDFDVKVGDLIVPREQAEELGYDKLVGSVVSVKDGSQEKGFHLVGRVLRNIHFSGVGLVKNPANERSIIMETAALKEYIENASSKDSKVVNLADINSLEKESSSEESYQPDYSSETFKQAVKNVVEEIMSGEKEESQTQKEESQTTGLDKRELRPGTCVSYKRYVYNIPTSEDDDLPEPPTDLTQYPLSVHPGTMDTIPPGAEVVREHYCALFDLDCTSRPGDATHPNCWRNVFARTVKEEIDSYEDLLRQRRINEGLVELQEVLDQARKLKTIS